ncbi:unnamed protein product [Prorocentrum cordatum]|uniref:Uncharacterized protein n=1 Tax=Prorocentrum cordatum TaxID=2364126 RepID=A0ABN9Y7A9_9DINO|nr:unnamed protein product [Polarella glacialis]
MQTVETVMQESPVGGHAAIGESENAVKEVKRIVRVQKKTLEERIGTRLPLHHPIWTGLPRHAAACLSRYRIGEDGRSAEQRRTGRRWAKSALEFGERIHVRLAQEEPRSGMTPKMIEGWYVGHQTRTGSLMVMTTRGVLRGKTYNKNTAEERWKPAGLDQVCRKRVAPLRLRRQGLGARLRPQGPVLRLRRYQAPRLREVDLSVEELENIAHLSLELGAVDVHELCPPPRNVALACRLGLRPGVSADMEAEKPNGGHWDFTKKGDVKEWFDTLEREDPYILIGSPLSTAFADLQGTSRPKRDTEQVLQEQNVAQRHLEVACESYRRQMVRGRYFLHEHPHDDSSWETPGILELLEQEAMKKDGSLSGLAEATAGPVPTEPDTYEQGRSLLEDSERYWDDVDPAMVRKRDYTAVLKQDGHESGKANPALFYKKVDDCRSLVHGDDFCAMGDDAETLRKKYDLKVTGRFTLGSGEEQEVVFLNRILRVTGSPEGERFEERLASPPLVGDDVRLYRSVTMRASYLAPDRADIGDAVKNLVKHMQSPKQVDMARLKRLARYLKGRPRVVQVLRRDQHLARGSPLPILVMVDSDNAGDKTSRRSTVGQVVFVGGQVVKHACNLLQVIGLSSGENEYYAISAGACTGLGIQGLLEDWQVPSKVKVVSDSSAARGFASRRGVGKLKHVQTRYLWVQERIVMQHLELGKIGTADNRSDLLTKPFGRKEIDVRMKGINQDYRSGRAAKGLLLK